MKYNQPYGVTDLNAPYINGNPSTGTMGSIPPAASIEYPQREIVNFITDSTLVPDNADLRQLSKSVQSGHVNYCDDQGTPNFIAITPTPPVTEYKLGLHFRIRINNINTGPTQLNVSNVGWAPVVHGDKSALGAREMNIGQMIDVAFDGAGNWQMMTGGIGGLIMMTEPQSFYVDANLGDDTLYDGTQATVDATHGHGPFKTLQKALTTMATYNLGGWTFNIYMADGNYVWNSLLMAPIPNGSGTVAIHGNPSNPTLCKLINAGAGGAIAISGGVYTFDGIYFQSTAGGSGIGGVEGSLWVDGFGQVMLFSTAFGNAAHSQILVGPGGSLSLFGPLKIYGSGGATAECFINGWSNAVCTSYSVYPVLDIYGAVTYTAAFMAVSGGAQFVVPFTAITIQAGGSVTGMKYSCVSNAVINTFGRGPNYFPGTVPGGVNTGGQYL